MSQYFALPWGSGDRGGHQKGNAEGRGVPLWLRERPNFCRPPTALEECRSVRPEQSLRFLPLK